MRIVGGSLAGRRLAAMGRGAPEAHLRPTSDRARETLFNILVHGPYPPLDGLRVLDLFAGAGSLGLEALSRGAERALFVDDHPKARALLRENIDTLGLAGRARVFRRDALRLGPNRDPAYDLVFLDPPYGQDLAARALAAAAAGGWLAPDALIVVETAAADPFEPPPGFTLTDARDSGAARLRFLSFSPPADA